MADPRRVLRDIQPLSDRFTYTEDLTYTPGVVQDQFTAADADLIRGYRSTTRGLRAGDLYRQADKEEVAGNIETANQLRGRAQELELTAQDISPRVGSFQDVEGVGDAVDFLQSGLGQLAPTMGPPLAAGLAGAAAGAAIAGPLGIAPGIAAGIGGAGAAAVPAFQMEAGEQASSQQADEYIRENTTAEQRLREQNIKGLQNAALESLFPAIFGGRVVGNAARRIAGEALKKSPLRRTATVAREGAIEAGTELTQTLTGQASLTRLNPNRDTSLDYVEQIDSIILGALGGTSISLGTTVPGYLAERAGARLGAEGDQALNDIGRAGAELELRVIQSRADQGGQATAEVPLGIKASRQFPMPSAFPAGFSEAREQSPQRELFAERSRLLGGQENREIEPPLSEPYRDYGPAPEQRELALNDTTPRLVVDNLMGEDARAQWDEITRQWVQANVAGDFKRVQRLEEQARELWEREQGNLFQQNILSEDAVQEGRGSTTLRLNQTTQEPTAPDINTLPERNIPVFPTSTQGAAKFTRQHVRKNQEMRHLRTLKREGFLDENFDLESARLVPLGDWMQERGFAPEEVQAEIDAMIRDIDHRIENAKSKSQIDKLKAEKLALKRTNPALNNYTVVEVPPDQILGRFTPQDAALQQRSKELISNWNEEEGRRKTNKEIAAERNDLEENQGIELKIGETRKGKPKTRRVYQQDVISHALDFFRDELSSYKDGPVREEAALMMGVFSDPRVTSILHNGKEIKQDDLNLENPEHRAALKLGPPERDFTPTREDPAQSREASETADFPITRKLSDGREVRVDADLQNFIVEMDEGLYDVPDPIAELEIKRRQVEERLAEAKPGSLQAKQARAQLRTLNMQLTRNWDETTKQTLRAPKDVIGVGQGEPLEGVNPNARPHKTEYVPLSTTFEKDFIGVSKRRETAPAQSDVPRETSKTASGNVVVKNGVPAARAYAAADPANRIYTLRKGGTAHFGNPFTHLPIDRTQGTVQQVGSVAEAVQAYRDWLTTTKYDGKFGPVIDARKKWILQQLPKLKGKELVYYKELNEPSHANVLDELVQEAARIEADQAAISETPPAVAEEVQNQRDARETSTVKRKFTGKPKTIALIGTAGRKEDKAKLTKAHWEAMVADAAERVRPEDTLVSGGAAWADHVAVQLFLDGKVKGLKLFLPSEMIWDWAHFGGPPKSAATAAQYYHEQFSKVIGRNSIVDLLDAFNKGAEVHYEKSTPGYGGFFARNKKVAAAADASLAYTFGESKTQPKDGGTLNTWNQINAEQKFHVPIAQLGQQNTAIGREETQQSAAEVPRETPANVIDLAEVKRRKKKAEYEGLSFSEVLAKLFREEFPEIELVSAEQTAAIGQYLKKQGIEPSGDQTQDIARYFKKVEKDLIKLYQDIDKNADNQFLQKRLNKLLEIMPLLGKDASEIPLYFQYRSTGMTPIQAFDALPKDTGHSLAILSEMQDDDSFSPAAVRAREQQQEPWQQGLPAHTIDRTLTNKDGSKRLASARDGKPVINPVETVEEFFNYLLGKVKGATSQQKLKMLGPLTKAGWPLTKIKKLITTPGLANRFLVLHEQSHLDNKDRGRYFAWEDEVERVTGTRPETNYLTRDKIEIEMRATKDALDQIEKEVAGGLKASKQFDKTPSSVFYGQLAKNLKEKGFRILRDPDTGEVMVVDKDGKRLEPETDELKKSMQMNAEEVAAISTKEDAERWLVRAFGEEMRDPTKLGWMRGEDMDFSAGDYNPLTDFMRLALNSHDPLSFAFHEGMHKFVKKLKETNPALYDRMVKAATAPHIVKQLEKHLYDLPSGYRAIDQLRLQRDPEEFVAYAFQLYAASRADNGPKFNLQPSLRQTFRKIMESIARVLGVMTHARATEKIFDALYEGRVNRDGIKSLEKYNERSFEQYSKDLYDTLRTSVPRLLSSPIIQLQKQRNAEGKPIKAFVTLANALHSEPLKGGESGLIYTSAQMYGQYRNRWHKVLTDHKATEEDMKKALKNFQAMRPPSNAFEEDIQKFFRRMYQYQFERGENPTRVLKVVDEETGRMAWEKPKQVDNYWPRIWSSEEILANEIEFREVMKEESKGELSDEQITNFIEMLQATNGLEAGSELQQYRAEFSPYNAAINARVFDFINENNAPRFAKFQEQNMDKVMDRYIRQATHRREHSRIFGSDGKGIDKLLEVAKSEGATPEQLEYAKKVVQGVEGRLGTDKVSDLQRELMVGSMSVTNYAVLAMATLSSMIDPLGVMVRTGSLKAATDTFKQGFAQIVRDARKTKTPDQELTEYLGIIEEDMVQDMLNNMERGIYMNEKLRKMNRFFFRSIGLEQWTRGTRVGAMRASLEYLKKYQNDKKRLAELGLKVGDVQIHEDRIALKPGEFKDGDQVEQARKMQNAVYRMVDESVLRPSAGTRPLWSSDMRFRLLGHLKSYTFTFHNQILRQVLERAKTADSRAQAALAFMPLLSYVPVMIAADMMRDMIQGDDKDRDLDEVVYRALQRSAILGMGTFLMDIDDELEWGGLPTNTVLGPVIDNAMNLGRTAVNPDASFLNAGAKLLPYNALWRKWGDED